MKYEVGECPDCNAEFLEEERKDLESISLWNLMHEDWYYKKVESKTDTPEDLEKYREEIMEKICKAME